MPGGAHTRLRAQIRITFATAAAVFAMLAVDASAATLSVDPNGSDANDGSAGAPLRTISKAASEARKGDTILVGSGRYPETVMLNQAHGLTLRGTGPTRPIVDGEGTRAYGFRNLNGDDVTIEGFEITGQVEAGVYSLGHRDRIANNVIHHVGSRTETHSNGVRVVWGSAARVIGNTIHHIGPGSESMGIWLLETRDAVVEANSVYLVRKEGIRDWKGLDNTIASNRAFLNWAGISLNTSTGSQVTNNYVYDNVEGLVAKHLSYSRVLDYWKLAEGRWSRFANNTVYRSSEAGLWVAQSDEPLDYLDVRSNVFAGPGYAYLRDRSTLRGPHVTVDDNLYAEGNGRARYLYKEGWSSSAGLNGRNLIQAATGWERTGGSAGLALNDAARGDLGSASPRGGHGLPAAGIAWTPYPMVAVDSSSKGTYHTDKHLQKSADGDQASYWLTATDREEHVTYDFDQPRTFDHLILTVFSHFDKRNPRDYRFEVSDDGRSWRTILEGTNPDSAGAAIPYELAAPATGRYLRFTMGSTFCTSYAPRSGCGEYFVLSDLQAGLLSGAAPQPAAKTGGRSPGARRPGVRVLRRGAVIRRGRLWVRVACARCPRRRTSMRVALSELGPRGRPVGARARALARARVTVRSGRSRRVGIRIRRPSLRRIAGRGWLRLRVVARLADGRPSTTVVRVRRPAR